ncbi:hypothetical protein [Brachyspira pulli]|uniref:hypothetical protein n=1 Tax=Brachyspira pulli TaxID=310721 RepID=UPI0030055EAA
MNKKIKTILFTLFVAGLLTVSCSSKDKTGPGDGGTTPPATPTIPTIPENGTGVNSNWRDRRFVPEADRKLKVTSSSGTVELSATSDFQLDPQKSDGSILVKMPLLKSSVGFTADVIKIPARNIVEGEGNNYTVKTRYTLEESADKTVTVDLEAESFNIYGAYLKMKVKLTKTTTVKDAEPATEIYTIETPENGLYNRLSQVSAIDGTGAIEPNYKK